MKFNSLSKVAGMRWHYVRTSAQFKHPIDPVSFTLNGLGMPVGTSVSDDRVHRHIGYWNGSGLSESPVDVRVGAAAPMARDMAELLATLRAEPRSESALEAATWILLNTPDGPEVEQAASVITDQHLMNTNLLVLCDGLERMRPRCATNLLSALMSGNPETEIRGRACWTLAGLWKDAADYGRNQAAAVMAEKLYERVLREFGQLKCPKNAKPGARTLAVSGSARLRPTSKASIWKVNR
jgi:hypothetical protein